MVQSGIFEQTPLSSADFQFSGPLEGGEVDSDLLDHVPAITEDTVASNLCILPKLPRGSTQAAAARHNRDTNGPLLHSNIAPH